MPPPTKRVYSLRVPEAQRVLTFGPPRWKSPDGDTTLSTLGPRRGTWSDQLLRCKRALDKPPYHNKWYAYKGLLNPYELIHVSSNRARTHENVAETLPLSRSYFKMRELLHDFRLLDDVGNGPIRTAHFAEGPGGFIEAVAHWRETRCACPRRSPVESDVYAGITLRSTRRDVPGWGKSKRVLAKYPQIKLHYGKDNTGDLYNVDNITDFARTVGRGACVLATGDGGIDYSVDFAHQEPLSFRLLLCQVFGAWLVLRRGGAFVCKFFDVYESFTIELIWLLSVTFDVVHIVKPHTSRPANSERYVVAKGYRGIPRAMVLYVHRLIQTWCESKGELQSVLALPVPLHFRRSLATYSEWYAEGQCRNIAQCLAIIDKELHIQGAGRQGNLPQETNEEGTKDDTPSLVEHSSDTDVTDRGRPPAPVDERLFQSYGSEPPSLAPSVLAERFPQEVRAQHEKAIAWCAKYGVPLNRTNRHVRRLLRPPQASS